MPLSERLIKGMEHARTTSEQMLAAFQLPQDWCYQVVPGVNHAMWFIGHMAVSDNFFLSLVAPGQEKTFDGWDKLFGMGSQPTSDPNDYPPASEVLEAMRERRAALTKALTGKTDAELAAPPAAGASEFTPDLQSIYEIVSWHETLHLGQVTVARRALGNRPLWGPPAAEATA